MVPKPVTSIVASLLDLGLTRGSDAARIKLVK